MTIAVNWCVKKQAKQTNKNSHLNLLYSTTALHWNISCLFRPQKIVWHGSDTKGNRMNHKSCKGWASHSRYSSGIGSSLMNGKMIDMDEYGCNNRFIVLCIEITSQKKLRR